MLMQLNPALQKKETDHTTLHTNGMQESDGSAVTAEEEPLQRSPDISNGPSGEVNATPAARAPEGPTVASGTGSSKTSEQESTAAVDEPAEKEKTPESSADSSLPQQNGMRAESAEVKGKVPEKSESNGKEESTSYCFSKGAYFIGKAVWGKVTFCSAEFCPFPYYSAVLMHSEALPNMSPFLISCLLTNLSPFFGKLVWLDCIRAVIYTYKLLTVSANVLYCAVVQGYTELLDLLLAHRNSHGSNLPVDAYGSGEDSDDIKERAERYELNVYFLGARDHLDDSIHPYRFSPCLRVAVCPL